MSLQIIFPLDLVLGYIAWLLCFSTYVWPTLKAMESVNAHRAIATFHSFRFIGLVFLIPGVVGPNLPANFAEFAAYWDLATALLAILALLTVRVRPLFWTFVIAFNIVGFIDLVFDYHHATTGGLSAMPGQLGAAYVIPVILVPAIMITHVSAFYLLIRPKPTEVRIITSQ
jgi:hypothetical protein